MTKRTYMRKPEPVIKVTPAMAKIARLSLPDLRRLLRPISTARPEVFEQVELHNMRVAAQSYLRTGRLTEQGVLAFKEEAQA